MRKVMVALAVLGVLAAGCGSGDASVTIPVPRTPAWAAAPASSAKPAPVPDLTWSFEHVVKGQGELLDVAALAPDDIWATGSVPDDGGDATDDYFLLHYDGKHWKRRPLPAVLGDHVYQPHVAAVGAGRLLLWGVAAPRLDKPWFARWDGTRWTRLPDSPGGRVVDAAAAGTDLWLLDGDRHVSHWDGTRWTGTTLPLTHVSALSAAAGDDVWAVGFRADGPGVDHGEREQPAAVHGDGRNWRTAPTPAYHYPDPVPPKAEAEADHVLALAPDDVVAYGTNSFAHGVVDDEPDDEQHIRLHWDGTRWSKQPRVPGECAQRYAIGADGNRGIFLDGNRYLAADGACTEVKQQRLPSTGGSTDKSEQQLWLQKVTAIPGTGKVIGAGHITVVQFGGSMTKAVVVVLAR